MDVSSNELIEKQFLDRMQNNVKSQMLLKYFRQSGGQTHFDVPLFTEFSGTKQIIPFRNTSCMTYKCVYDLNELLVKYRNSVYSNYINFICHTCRKMIDMANFSKDTDLERIINKVWPKYNTNGKMICAAVTMYSNNEWDPILPNYVRKLEKNMNKGQEDSNKFSQHEVDDQASLQNLEVFENIPMLDKFDVDEYKRLLIQFVDDDQPRLDNEIILKIYKQQMKWGEFTHIRSQTAFVQAPMSIYVSYLSDYYNRKVGGQRPIAFTVIKVTSFDTYRSKAQFYYVSDNFDTLTGSIVDNCRIAVFVLNFDERWMLVIVDIRGSQLRLLDFLDDKISRFRQDELYEMSVYIVEQVCPPIKIKRSFGQLQVEKDQLNAKIIQEQMQELKKKVQFYTDCGHQLAQYLYYFIKQEIDQQSTSFPQVSTKVGEKDLFTARICWLFLKMTQQESVKIPFYKFKPQIENKGDSIDQLMKSESHMSVKSSKKLLRAWDFTRNNETKNKNNVSNTVGNILLDMNQDSSQASVEKSQIRASKYWNMPVQQKLNVDGSPRSIIKKQGLKYNSAQSSVYSPTKSAFINPKEQKQKENPFFSMPRWQLQQLLEAQKQKIIEAYSQKTIAQQYYRQKFRAEQRPIQRPIQYKQAPPMQVNQLQQNFGEDDDIDEELKQLQMELGLDDQDLADLNLGSYDEMMSLLNKRGGMQESTSTYSDEISNTQI